MSEFDFLDELRRLSADQQQRFQRVVSRLLNGEVITPGENPLATVDPDWRFLERNLAIVNGYLDVAGWRVDLHASYRMARAVHQNGQHKVRFNLLESLVICILRLAYHEQMGSGARDDRCQVATGELRERISQAQRTAQPVHRTPLTQAIRKLKRYGIVEVSWGYAGEDGEEIVVTPVVEMVLSTDAVHRFFTQYASPQYVQNEASPTDRSEYAEDEYDVEEVVGDA